MNFFDRLSNGWKLGKTSISTIAENPILLLFPIMSGATMLLIIISMLGGGWAIFGGQDIDVVINATDTPVAEWVGYIVLFVIYLMAYTVAIFFNVGLVYGARKVLEGEKASFMDGVQFAASRFGIIFSWAFVASTVGIILNTLQERLGGFGKIVTGLIGMVWNIATFFVLPVLAFENLSPKAAVKKSAQIMEEAWGESIGANFTFGIFYFLGILLIALPAGFITGYLIHPGVGVAIGFLALIIVVTTISAANTVFLTATYQYVSGNPTGNFDGGILDDVFVEK